MSLFVCNNYDNAHLYIVEEELSFCSFCGFTLRKLYSDFQHVPIVENHVVELSTQRITISYNINFKRDIKLKPYSFHEYINFPKIGVIYR